MLTQAYAHKCFAYATGPYKDPNTKHKDGGLKRGSGGGMAPQLRWQNHGIVLDSPRSNGALKPLIWRAFPWEIWFTNILDMIVPLYTTSAPSALSALFGSFWVILPKWGSQSKKFQIFANVEGPGIYTNAIETLSKRYPHGIQTLSKSVQSGWCWILFSKSKTWRKVLHLGNGCWEQQALFLESSGCNGGFNVSTQEHFSNMRQLALFMTITCTSWIGQNMMKPPTKGWEDWPRQLVVSQAPSHSPTTRKFSSCCKTRKSLLDESQLEAKKLGHAFHPILIMMFSMDWSHFQV